MAERNGLLNRRTSKGYRGFESLPHRKFNLLDNQVEKVNLKIYKQKQSIFTIFANLKSSGCSVARLSRLVWDQKVASSNLATPTYKILSSSNSGFFLLGNFQHLLSHVPCPLSQYARLSQSRWNREGRKFESCHPDL